MRKDLPEPGIQTQQARRSIELLEHRVEDTATCFHVTTVHGLANRIDPVPIRSGTLLNTNRSSYLCKRRQVKATLGMSTMSYKVLKTTIKSVRHGSKNEQPEAHSD